MLTRANPTWNVDARTVRAKHDFSRSSSKKNMLIYNVQLASWITWYCRQKPKKALLAYRFTCYQGKFTLFSNCTVCVRPCVLSKSNLLAVSFETTSEIAATFTCDLGGFAPVSKLLGWGCVYASNLRKTWTKSLKNLFNFVAWVSAYFYIFFKCKYYLTTHLIKK